MSSIGIQQPLGTRAVQNHQLVKGCAIDEVLRRILFKQETVASNDLAKLELRHVVGSNVAVQAGICLVKFSQHNSSLLFNSDIVPREAAEVIVLSLQLRLQFALQESAFGSPRGLQ